VRLVNSELQTLLPEAVVAESTLPFTGGTEEDQGRPQEGRCPAGVEVLLESCLQTCMTYTIAAECTVNKLLMMDRGTV
jgi:hypothetical protein